MDLDEFTALLETRPKEERWHLIEGVAVRMAPRSFAHARSASNLCEVLNGALAAQNSELFAYPRVAIRLPGLANFQPEPDVVVAQGTAGYDVFTHDFRLVAEILSPSNTRAEIKLKLRRYREAAGNLYTVVIQPRELLVEIHARSRNWEPLTLHQSDDLIEMPEFGLRCPVGELYRGTPLDPARRG